MPAIRSSVTSRRTLFRRVFGWFVGLGFVARARAQKIGDEARKARPQKGDVFVHALGERQGEVVLIEHLAVGGPPVICYAREPLTGVVRDGSRLNQVLLLRLDPEELSEESRAVSARGVVAYSAICPHTGCDVSMWRQESRNLLCSCHDSEFDPRQRARVVSGPAPRRLPALPLTAEDGRIVAAGGFDARIRFQREF